MHKMHNKQIVWVRVSVLENVLTVKGIYAMSGDNKNLLIVDFICNDPSISQTASPAIYSKQKLDHIIFLNWKRI